MLVQTRRDIGYALALNVFIPIFSGLVFCKEE